jgi:hydroxylamine reductase (hybrid-cluster protein)
MSETKPKPASFCYRCGRRVGKEVETCWYCGAPTKRWIRQPKRCPFCGEDVRAEAVKCRHCGEFIDGRPRPAEAQAQQIIFVVDRNMFRGMADARLLAGQPVPPEVARALDAQTVRAIESGSPA